MVCFDEIYDGNTRKQPPNVDGMLIAKTLHQSLQSRKSSKVFNLDTRIILASTAPHVKTLTAELEPLRRRKMPERIAKESIIDIYIRHEI
jgi:hypothetical protein